MGGLGSGRPSGSGHVKVESCRSLDVNRLHQEGCLRSGWCGNWQWQRDGKLVAWINLRADQDQLHLTYRVRIGGGDWEEVMESILIVRVACRYGGARPYFMCPGVVNSQPCRRRVAKVYGPGRYFLCRRCNRLSYASQCEGGLDRALRRANRIRLRLGGETGLVSPFPERPKGMWGQTYERLKRQSSEAEMRAEEAMDLRLVALSKRLDQSRSKGSFWR